ncbi:transcriptional regulator with XRE-family HTH domain [Sinorhizobium meliloti]
MADMAQQIRLARKRLRMNQTQFAEALGASQGSVSKWESGREVPRFETIQRISEIVEGFVISGDKTPVLKRKQEREMNPAAVTVMGTMKDGHVPHREKPIEITALVTEGWERHAIEAWYFMNRYDWAPDHNPNLGIFARLRDEDRIDDMQRGDKFLVEIQDGDEGKYCLVTLEGAPGALSLWPVSRDGRRFLQPIPLTAGGRPAWPNTRVLGIMIGTYTFTALSDAESAEPYEF